MSRYHDASQRTVPGETSDDIETPAFFEPSAADMTIERFREIALKVLWDSKSQFTITTKIEYIKAKAVWYGLPVDDNWLTGLLNDASNGEIVRVSGPSNPA